MEREIVETVTIWLMRSEFGRKFVNKFLSNPMKFAVALQWILVGLYFPFAYISQWIPLFFIVWMDWSGDIFQTWRQMIKWTSPKNPVVGLGTLLSSVATELLKYIFLFAALFDLFGSVVDGENVIEGVWSHVYFSTVTITTLGYGNLVPSGMFSEVLAAIESLIGFLFFALLAGFSATIIVERIRAEDQEDSS